MTEILLVLLGVSLGVTASLVFYHFHLLRQLKVWGVDWRARAISAEQEVDNWKGWAKLKGFADPFR